jgi:quercetin 2,3-dioxygenase
VSNAVDVIEARKAAIGDGTEVRRLLPQRTLRTIGAWCFLDHYGPDEVSRGPGMRVPPHPHIGLQTVSWLSAGAPAGRGVRDPAVTGRRTQAGPVFRGRRGAVRRAPADVVDLRGAFGGGDHPGP